MLRLVINISILCVYTRSVHGGAIRSTERLDWIQETFPGALNAVRGRLVLSTLFTMRQTTSWYEPKLW